MIREDSSTSCVKSACGETENFNAGVGVHQGLSSLYSFSVVTDRVTKEIRDDAPWCSLIDWRNVE